MKQKNDAKLSYRAKKSLGQNFLMHRATAERIVQGAKLPPHARVLEIGPGRGLLTRALLDAGHLVTAVEADAELIPFLKEQFEEEERLTLVHEDIRSFKLETLKNPYFVVANIPYYITGEIIRHILTTPNKPASVTLLVQKEVAERIARSRKESILSLSVKVFGTPKVCFTVPRGAFVPAPKVDSAVLHISDIRAPFKKGAQEQGFFEIVHAGFAHKRKQLAKNLEAVSTPEKIRAAFAKLQIPPQSRAEDVPLTSWLALTQNLT